MICSYIRTSMFSLIVLLSSTLLYANFILIALLTLENLIIWWYKMLNDVGYWWLFNYLCINNLLAILLFCKTLVKSIRRISVHFFPSLIWVYTTLLCKVPYNCAVAMYPHLCVMYVQVKIKFKKNLLYYFINTADY